MSYQLLRSSVVRGPAVLVINNGDGSTGDQYFFSKDDIHLEWGHSTFDVANSAYGVVDKRAKERMAKITFTPVGNITTGMATVLWPYIKGNFQPGDSALKNATSDPYVIVAPKAGAQYKFFGTTVTKQPEIMLSADKTQIGSVELTAIGQQGADWGGGTDGATGSGSLYLATTTTYGTILTSAALAVSSIKTGPYTATYGSSLGASGTFSTNAGFNLSFNSQMQPVETDEFGLFDWTIGDQSASVSCAPLDITADQIAAAIPMQSASRGASLQSGVDLVIDTTATVTTGLLYATLKNATIFQTGFTYNVASQRIPQLTFTTVRSLSSGSLGAPAIINIH